MSQDCVSWVSLESACRRNKEAGFDPRQSATGADRREALGPGGVAGEVRRAVAVQSWTVQLFRRAAQVVR